MKVCGKRNRREKTREEKITSRKRKPLDIFSVAYNRIWLFFGRLLVIHTKIFIICLLLLQNQNIWLFKQSLTSSHKP